jgi:ABC-type transport system involved in multi-copper enzyme maturation permease subunit
MSMRRIWAVTLNVFREVIRDRILYVIGFFALVMVIALRLLPDLAAAQEAKISVDFGLATINIIGVLVAIFVGTSLVSKEIEKKTILVLIPKPINRWEFILGKHLGLSGVMAVLIASMTIIYLILLSFYNISYPLGNILLAVVYLFFQVSLIVAVAILFGVFTSPLLGILLSVGIYLMGNYTRDLVEVGKLSQNPQLESIAQALYVILPDLSRLDIKNTAVYGILPSVGNIFTDGFYGVVYTLLLLAIATLIFSRRQF